MIIFDELEPYVCKLLNDLKTMLRDDKSVEGIYNLHGTFHGGKKKGLKYVSDVDMECHLRHVNNNEKQLASFTQRVALYMMKNHNCYPKEILSGIDDRFSFGFYILKDGMVIGYDDQEILNKLENLKNSKVITEDEFNSLETYVVPEPTLADIEKLKLQLEPYQLLKWSLNDFKKGTMTHRRKKFYLYSSQMTRPTICAFVWDYDPGKELGKYVSLDIAFRIFELSNDNSITYNKIVNDGKIVNDETFGHTTIFLYEGIFKNYVQEKYMKILKRIRSLISQYIFFVGEDDKNDTYEPGRERKHKDLLQKIRREILVISTNEELSCLNQIKNRIDNIITLTKYLPEKQIRKLISNLISDTENVCGFKDFATDNLKKIIEKKGKLNISTLVTALKELKSSSFRYLNTISLPYLIEIWDQISYLFPFRLIFPVPEEDRL